MIAALRRKPFVSSLAVLLALTITSGCGGNFNTPDGPVVGSPGGGGPPPTRLVDVKVTVTLPVARGGLRPDYLSKNTESLAIALETVNGKGVTGVNPTIVNTLPKSRDCKSQSQSIVCSATAKGSPGNDVFGVTAYDGPGSTGAVLSVGTAEAKISGNGGNVGIYDRLPLTLDGIIASMKLAVDPHEAKRGEKTTANVSLNAYDASGAEIVGPSDYALPVELAIEGDANKSFRLQLGVRSGESLSIPKPTSAITLSYDGNKQASAVTIQASVSGPSGISAGAGFNLSGRQPPPPIGTIYVLNLGTGSGQGAFITEYGGKAKGNAAPERTLSLDKALYAVSIAVDSSGNLYVGYFDSTLGESGGKPDAGNEIAMYAPGASGNDEPTSVLQADPSTSTAIYPIFITFDPSGRLVTYGASSVDKNAGDAVLTYATGSSGPAAPAYAFDFQSPTLYYPGPSGIAIDSTNNVYLNGTFKLGFGSQSGLYVAEAADIGNPYAQPSRTIPWDSYTKLTAGLTTDVALNTSGEIFIGNVVKSGSGSGTTCQAAANVYAAGAGSGYTDNPPLRTLVLSGIRTQGSDCTNISNPLDFYFPEIQMYGGSALFAVDAFNDAVAEYPSGGHGTVKPVRRIAGAATQLASPIGLFVTSISGPAKAGPVTGDRAGLNSFTAPDAQ